MTFVELENLLKENNIPKDVFLMSDSGWECDPTYMDGVFYNKDINTIIFTQGGEFENYEREGYIRIDHSAEEDYRKGNCS